MAFSSGNSGGPMAEINVTPLVDVMLVLLIIFMITTPLMNHKVKVKLPEVVVDKKDDDSNYARVPASGAGDAKTADDDWRHTKVHVGKHAGVELVELDPQAIRTLHERWLPEAKALLKPKADDKRLIAALEKADANGNAISKTGANVAVIGMAGMMLVAAAGAVFIARKRAE